MNQPSCTRRVVVDISRGARIGIAVLAVSFVVLGCTDPDRRIAEATLTRWEQGIDPMLDTGVLSACGATHRPRPCAA